MENKVPLYVIVRTERYGNGHEVDSLVKAYTDRDRAYAERDRIAALPFADGRARDDDAPDPDTGVVPLTCSYRVEYCRLVVA